MHNSPLIADPDNVNLRLHDNTVEKCNQKRQLSGTNNQVKYNQMTKLNEVEG